MVKGLGWAVGKGYPCTNIFMCLEHVLSGAGAVTPGAEAVKLASEVILTAGVA